MNSEALGVSGAPGVRGNFRVVKSLGSAMFLGRDDSLRSEKFPGSEGEARSPLGQTRPMDPRSSSFTLHLIFKLK